MIKTILIVIKHFNFGGTERYALSLAHALQKKGIQVILVGDVGPLAKYISPSIKTFFAPISRDPQEKMIAETIILEIAKKYHVDLIHAQCRNSLACSQKARTILHIPVIGHEHLTYPDSEYPCVVADLQMYADRVISVGPYSTKKLLSFGFAKKNIHTVFNGVDLQAYPLITRNDRKIARRAFSLQDTDKVVVCLSRIVPGKYVEELVEAFITVIKHIPNAKLLIAGDGESHDTRAAIQNTIRKHRLTKHIFLFPGEFNIRKFHAVADVFCYPAIAKGMAVMEAMASELPVVAKKPNRKPYVTKNNISGLLLETTKPDHLAQKLITLLQNPVLSRQMGAAGRQTIAQHFPIEKMVTNVLGVYHQTMLQQSSYRYADSLMSVSENE